MTTVDTPESVLRIAGAAGAQRARQLGMPAHTEDVQGAAIAEATKAWQRNPAVKVVRKAAHHGAIDYARHLYGRRTTRAETWPTDPSDIPEPHIPGERNPIGETTDRIAVEQMIDSLPRREQVVVRGMMQVRQGSRRPDDVAHRRQVFDRMAREAGVCEGQCYNIYRRALGKMRRMLTGQPPEAPPPRAGPRVRLSAAQAADIRARYQEGGVTMAQLGWRFGVSKDAVSKIVAGRSHPPGGAG